MYSVRLEGEAERDLLRLDVPTRKRLRKRLQWLGDHFGEVQPEALTGQWTGHFKFRVGDYRAIFYVDHAQQQISVVRIRHRREVYD